MPHLSTSEALRRRYATKVFDSTKKISEKIFSEIIESLWLSPSSFGLQPWKFVIVKNPSIRRELVQHAWGQKQVEEASHLIVLCSLTDITADHIRKYIDDTAKVRAVSRETLNGFEGMMLKFISGLTREGRLQWMKDQVYIALGFLMFETAMRGVDSCPMEGFDAKKFDEVLKLEEKGIRSVVLCPVGYRSASDKHAALAKVRFPKDKIFVTME